MNTTIDTVSLAHKYAAILKAEGFEPTIDNDGDVIFKFEGGNYIFILDKDDPQYLRLCYPSFLKTTSDQHRRIVLDAMNEVNANVKVGKVFLVEDRCWAVTENLIPDPSFLASTLTRYLRIIQTLAKETFERSEQK